MNTDRRVSWRACFATTAMLLGNACGNTTTPEALVARPHWLYTMSDKQAHALAYDSRGRGAYMAPTDAKMKLCAEPPPDTSANLAADSSSKVGIDAAATYTALAAKLGISSDTKSNVSSQIADVAQRSELVLLMRDMLYRICEMQFNGTVDSASAAKLFDQVLQTTVGLGSRENVSKLVAILDTPGLENDTKHQVLVTILALSLASQAASAQPGLAREAQELTSVKLLQGIAAVGPLCSNLLAAPPKGTPEDLCLSAYKQGKQDTDDAQVTGSDKKTYYIELYANGGQHYFGVMTDKKGAAGRVKAADCSCTG